MSDPVSAERAEHQRLRDAVIEHAVAWVDDAICPDELFAAARALRAARAARGARAGFAVLVFSFDGPEPTWISNADRAEMVRVLEELLARARADTLDELTRPKGRG